MKVTVTLNISQQEFFDYLIQSIMIDIFKNTDVFKCEEEIKKGIQYHKMIKNANGKEIPVQVEIDEYQYLELYRCRINVGSNVNIIQYECQKIDDNHTLIIYTEDYESSKRLNKYNYKLMSLILSHTMKKKIKKMLIAMETHVKRSKYE